MEVDSLRAKTFNFGETTNQDSHCRGYALFLTSVEHKVSPSLNLNHNAYSIFPRIHVTLCCKNGDHLSKFDQSQNIPESGYWPLIGCLTEPEVPFSVFLGTSGIQGNLR